MHASGVWSWPRCPNTQPWGPESLAGCLLIALLSTISAKSSPFSHLGDLSLALELDSLLGPTKRRISGLCRVAPSAGDSDEHHSPCPWLLFPEESSSLPVEVPPLHSAICSLGRKLLLTCAVGGGVPRVKEQIKLN